MKDREAVHDRRDEDFRGVMEMESPFNPQLIHGRSFLLCLKMSEKEKPNENDRDHKEGDKRDRDEIDGANDPGGPEKWALAKFLCKKGFPKKNIPDDFKTG